MLLNAHSTDHSQQIEKHVSNAHYSCQYLISKHKDAKFAQLAPKD